MELTYRSEGDILTEVGIKYDTEAFTSYQERREETPYLGWYL